MALTDKLSAIGEAIREKTGKSELLTLDAMPIEILAITTGEGGGGADIPEEAFLIKGDEATYAFYNGGWDWFIEKYGDKITTDALTNPKYMFANSDVDKIPFNLYIASGDASYCFYNCAPLEEIADIYIASNKGGVNNFSNMFSGCSRLKEIPNITNVAAASTNTAVKFQNLFASCCSIRKLPSWITNIYDNINNSASALTANVSFYNAGLQSCYCLDEAIDLPVYCASATTNRMTNFIVGCYRLSRLTFQKVLGTPITAKWTKQTLDFTQGNTGYAMWAETLTSNYNGGITADKEVTDDASYQALKNDPDWFTCKREYSRYNHDSAVETINSLPDTTSGGGGNTIKFYADAGSATDGGAIGNLTDAEIAVATAKGWTVTLV